MVGQFQVKIQFTLTLDIRIQPIRWADPLTKLVMSYDREMSPLFDPTSSLPLFIPNDKENESNNSCLW